MTISEISFKDFIEHLSFCSHCQQKRKLAYVLPVGTEERSILEISIIKCIADTKTLV